MAKKTQDSVTKHEKKYNHKKYDEALYKIERFKDFFNGLGLVIVGILLFVWAVASVTDINKNFTTFDGFDNSNELPGSLGADLFLMNIIKVVLGFIALVVGVWYCWGGGKYDEY